MPWTRSDGFAHVPAVAEAAISTLIAQDSRRNFLANRVFVCA